MASAQDGPRPGAAARVKSCQAIVVLCSGADADAAARPAAVQLPFGGLGRGYSAGGAAASSSALPTGGGHPAGAHGPQAPAERWTSWADSKPAAREKLVEEELARIHKEYCRLFQQHGGMPRAKPAEGKAAAPAPCRACFDPTQEHLMTVIGVTRKMTKERIVFHYMHQNAPSVPALRCDGKLLLYCQDSNEQLPLQLGAVHEQLRSPAVYLFDCPHAGRLVRTLDGLLPEDEDVVAFGTSGETEALPWAQLGLPADLFTACLMSPVRTALNFYRAQGTMGVLPEVAAGALRLVAGKPQDRNTPLGELGSVFTAVTDAIAWSSLPPRAFQTLFREDGALAELSRNFLLATRVLQSFGLTATSRPALPPTHGHHLWDVWDATLEVFLLRLVQQQAVPPTVPGQPQAPANMQRQCPFFDEQMAAFSVWLRFQPSLGGENDGPTAQPPVPPPVELPVMLQGLLHPSCRLQALHLLALFADLGKWAVHYTLAVGARPYLTKLLSHEDQEALPEVPALALVVWTKILVTDAGREGLPGKDTYKGFFRLLESDHLTDYHRALAAISLAVACRGRSAVKLGLLQLGVLDVVEQLLAGPRHTALRWGACLLCAEACRDCARAAHAALHGPAAEALLAALADPSPEVRASAASAVGAVLAAQHPAAPAAEAEDSLPQPLRPRGLEGILPRLEAMPLQAAPQADAPVAAAAAAPHEDARWRWLARSLLGHFCREPLVEVRCAPEAAAPPQQGAGQVPLEAPLLSEACLLVRYELAVALAPWLEEFAASQLLPSPSLGSLHAACETDASVTPDQVDEVASGSSVSSCASTPTLRPIRPRSPHARPNVGQTAAPTAAAQQAERRFMQILVQDPMLGTLEVSRRFASALGGGGRLGQHARAAPLHAFGLRGDGAFAGEPLSSLRRVSSESSVARLRLGVAAEEDLAALAPPALESIVFSCTMAWLQQPNALAKLHSAGEEPGPLATDWALSLVLAGVAQKPSDGRPLAETASVPHCPWGVPPPQPEGEEDALGGVGLGPGLCDPSDAGLCRFITLPCKPCLPLVPAEARRGETRHRREGSKAAPPFRPAHSPTPSFGQGLEWASASPATGSRCACGPARPGDPAYEFERGVPAAATSATALAAPPALLLDLRMDEILQGEDFPLFESFGPTAAAVCVHPALGACVVAGRRGRLAVVRYGDQRRPAAHGFDLYEAERTRFPSSSSSASASGSGPRLGTREEQAAARQLLLLDPGGSAPSDPHQTLLCCAMDDGAVHICRCWGCAHHRPVVVSAFQALPRRVGAALTCHWCQRLAQLVAGGKDPHIRIWDLAAGQLVRSLRHGSGHSITCVTQGEAAWPADSCGDTDSMVFAGRQDGALLAVDARTRPGVAQLCKGALEAIATITPGLSSTEAGGVGLVAASDTLGAVEIWDMRKERQLSSFHLGAALDSPSEAAPSRFRRLPTLSRASPSVMPGTAGSGLIAALRPPPQPTSSVAILDLPSGSQHARVSLPRGLQPLSLGFHADGCSCAVLGRSGTEARLLVYSRRCYD